MRFNLGPIPEECVPNAEWQALDEPEPKIFVTRATVYVGLPIFALILSIWNLLGFLFGDIFRDLGFARQVLLGLCFYIALVVVHEAIHLCFHPQQGRSRHSVVGVMFKPLVFYAQYLGELSRTRFVAILLAPFLVLSVFPLVVVAIVGAPANLGVWLALISSVNAFAACADVLGAALCLMQMPGNASVRNNGWKSYWRYAGNTAL